MALQKPYTRIDGKPERIEVAGDMSNDDRCAVWLKLEYYSAVLELRLDAKQARALLESLETIRKESSH